MDTTRRQVLVQGAVIGAGIVASHLTGTSAFAAPPPVRRSLQGLAWNDPIVATYRDAVGIMKNKPASDPLSWVALSQIHGTQFAYKYCPHGDWYFLPWHRAFVVMYERIVRQLTGNNDFAMPFWDWTADAYFPQVFVDQTTPDGKTNWLAVQPSEGKSRTLANVTPVPQQYVGQSVLNQILASSPFERFGTSRNPKQTTLDPSWVPAGGGVQGILEATPHNNVHNLIGGWMPTGASPRDPVFFMHHSNIDRIWAVWNLKHDNTAGMADSTLWTDMRFTNNYVNPDGTTYWSPQVKNLYVPELLGYSYGLPAQRIQRSSELMALDSKIQLGLARAPAGGDVSVVTTDSPGKAQPDAPLSIALAIPQGFLSRLALRAPLGSGVSALAFDDVQLAQAAEPRVLAILRDLDITDAATTSFRVYLAKDGLAPDTPTTDPHYVGSFAVLDHSGGEGGGHAHGAAPSIAVELTDALRRVYGTLSTSGPIALQILPVPIGQGAKAGTVAPKSVEALLISG